MSASGSNDDELAAAAAAFAAALPASVTLPAGAGKTHLLAATVRDVLADDSHRVLVLTHTHAGVQAVTRRLRSMGVSSRVTVATLTSFAFQLARAYPHVGQLTVPDIPDWDQSSQYVAAARRVAAAANIADVLTATYTHLLVDEYQDCSQAQHELVTTLAQVIEKTGVLGDPMQAIFAFGDPLVDWTLAQQQFPKHATASRPWRWDRHNRALGQWLLELRDTLAPGRQLSFSGLATDLRISYIRSAGNPIALRQATQWTQRPSGESIVVLTAWANTARSAGATLGGSYTVMEEIAGKFMTDHLRELATTAPEHYATWLLNLAKKCLCGHAKLDNAVKTALGRGGTVGHLSRPGLEPALTALDDVVTNPTYTTLADAMDTMLSADSLNVPSREAWTHIQLALRGGAAAGDDPAALLPELDRAREHLRRGGRREGLRVVSRTVLVKGLEYDHVVIADVHQLRDVNNLYVALTRARKSITVIGSSDTITLT